MLRRLLFCTNGGVSFTFSDTCEWLCYGLSRFNSLISLSVQWYEWESVFSEENCVYFGSFVSKRTCFFLCFNLFSFVNIVLTVIQYVFLILTSQLVFSITRLTVRKGLEALILHQIKKSIYLSLTEVPHFIISMTIGDMISLTNIIVY